MPHPNWDGRILYMSAVDISRPNGPGVNEREFVLSLVKHLGDRARLVLPAPQEDTPDLEQIRPYATFTTPVPGKGLRKAWWPQREQYQAALALHREQPFNLVVTRLGQYPLGLYWLLRDTGLPLAIKTLGIGIPDIPKSYTGLHGVVERTRRRIRRPVHRWAVRRLLRRAMAVDTCTPQLREQITRHLPVPPGRVFLVSNTTNADRFRPRDTQEARQALGLEGFSAVLGYVGGQPGKKGGREMIETAARLREDYPDLGVVIVGGDVDNLRRLAEERGVSEHTVLPGKVPYDAVPGYINAFDVGFALLETVWEDTVGNDLQKVRQYLASGVPVIASPGGNQFLIDEGLGAIAAPEDLDGIEAATRQWLGLAGPDRTAFRERAHTYVAEHLSTDATLAQRLDHWRTLLANEGT